jgi:hypothetical protein
MKRNIKFRLLALAVLISLLLSIVETKAVFAEDAVPPATEEPVSTTEPVENSAEATVTDAESAGMGAETSTVTLPEILDQLPQETDVFVVADGEVAPLATQAAANVFVAGDPIWCEDGAGPVAGGAGCTDSYTDLLSLIIDIEAGNALNFDAAKDGTIWIMGDDFSASAIVIDDTIFPSWNGSALTLQGGWDGTSTIGSNVLAAPSVFIVPISITNWDNKITINNITINGANGIGLELQTSGDVTLQDVISTNNDQSGIVVFADGNVALQDVSASSNGLGLVSGVGADLISGSGSVTLTGWNVFEDNLQTGLKVDASADINAENITANGNGGSGADLTSGGTTALFGDNAFDDNLGGSGLVIDSSDEININSGSFSASNNDANGADLTAGSNVSLVGSINAFNGNLGGSGLIIDSSGEIDINSGSFSASNNDANGADLTAVLNVSLNGTANSFSGNGYEGLLIASNSDVYLENITASNNNAAGAVLNVLGGLTMNGGNVFNNNADVGLYIDAGGNIDAENITANQNGLTNGSGGGAELYTPAGFSLDGLNIFNGNRNTGLVVTAGADINALNITASSNGDNGAEFYTPGGFSLSGTNVFNHNVLDGLLVYSNGFVSIKNTTAAHNGGKGIFIVGNGSAIIDCGLAVDNIDYDVETHLSGALTLAGVDFGGDMDNIDITAGQLTLTSNGCFRYPNSNGEAEDTTKRLLVPTPDPIKIQSVNIIDQQTVELDCDAYGGTRLSTPGGGVYIPCPIDTSARLRVMTDSVLPGALSDLESYVSGLNFSITLDPSGEIRSLGSQVVQWKGQTQGVANPFINVFFSPPSGWSPEHLAILYWDGASWVELSDDQYFGNGKVTQKVGFTADGYFTAIVNFTGIFILVQK